MSYEYKEKIKEDLEYSLEAVSTDYYSSEELIHKQKVKELDNVYAQAAEYKEYRADTEKLYNALKAKGEEETLKYKAKADEYEAKAKAFDAICKAHVPLEHRMSPVTIDEGLDFAEETEEIILKFYENGEPNVKK